MKASGIAEFEMERPDLKVGLKFVGAAPVYAAPVAAPVVAASVPAVAAVPTAAPPAPATPAADPHEGAHIVKSPIVGTFYDAPSPGAAPFVEIGEEVSVGKVLCIIEAMKLMNEIESDAAGKVVKVFVKPGQPVEYGQPLFAVK